MTGDTDLTRGRVFREEERTPSPFDDPLSNKKFVILPFRNCYPWSVSGPFFSKEKFPYGFHSCSTEFTCERCGKTLFRWESKIYSLCPSCNREVTLSSSTDRAKSKLNLGVSR